jgi:hypothetical protein
MITKVTKTKLSYTCTAPAGADRCGAQITLKLKDLEPVREDETLHLPACSACHSIRVLDCHHPFKWGPEMTIHPGYNKQEGHTAAALELIHGYAVRAALQKVDPAQVYDEHEVKG